jgi:predicted Zn-dependent peptidase
VNKEKIFIFPNGLKVITLHIPEKKKIGMMVAIAVGSIHETSETDGVAHFTEHLLFKSNRHRNGHQLLRDMEWKGIQPGAATDRDSTYFRIVSPPAVFDDAIRIAFEAYRNLDYRQEELETEREVVITEIKRCAENPGQHLIHNLLMPYYFKGTDLERNVFGQVRAIANITYHEMINFKAKHYIPQNTVIAIAGNFEEKAVFDKIESTFGQLPKSHYNEAKPNTIVSPIKREPLYEARENIGQIYLGQIIGAADRFGGEDYFSLRLLETAIGRDMCCRMFEELREKRGIGYLVSSIYQNHPENCIILYVGGIDPKRLDETRKVLDNIIYDIAENGLLEDELEGVRCKAISLLHDRLENLDDITLDLFRKAMYGFTCSILNEEDGYRNLSAPILKKVAQKYLTRPRLEAGIIPTK